MITGCLQQKNGYYYALLYLKVDGKRKVKWISTKLPVSETSERKAKKVFDEIRSQYEKAEEERIRREAEEKILAEKYPPEARLEFSKYMEKWLSSIKSSIATATYQSYANMVKARITPYFKPMEIELKDLSPQHIEDFYQKILSDNCTTNTVIHYHAIIRKALQSAVRKDIITKNPADKVDRPKKNVYHGTFYTESEMLELFDAVEGDPLELCVKIAAYYGLRRSEVLGLRWSAIDLEIRPCWRRCIENQVQLSDAAPYPRSGKADSGGKRKAGDVQKAVQKVLLQRLSRIHLCGSMRQTSTPKLCNRALQLDH